MLEDRAFEARAAGKKLMEISVELAEAFGRLEYVAGHVYTIMAVAGDTDSAYWRIQLREALDRARGLGG